MAVSNDKITLFRGFRNSNSYVWSPFVTKLEFRFRYSDLPYCIEEGSPREGPNGKIPYVDVGALKSATTTSEVKPELIADSTLIIASLIECGHLDDLNANLTPAQKATDLALKALFEDKLYFMTMSERWIDNYYVHRDKILESKPSVIKFLLGILIHRKIVQTVHLQGCGRFSVEEQRVFRQEIWKTLEAMLAEQRRGARGEEPFWCLGGEKPTEADAVVFAFVSSALVCQSGPESMKFVKSLPAIMDYANRIHQKLFPDYEMWEE